MIFKCLYPKNRSRGKHATILHFAFAVNLEPKNAQVAWHSYTAQRSAASKTTCHIAKGVKNFKEKNKTLRRVTCSNSTWRKRKTATQKCNRFHSMKRWTNLWLATSESVPRQTNKLPTRGSKRTRSQRKSFQSSRRSPKKVVLTLRTLKMAGRCLKTIFYRWFSLSSRKIGRKATICPWL